MTITYLTGDATVPQTAGRAIIAHVCNDIGAWGAGFSGAISRRWPEPEAAFRRASLGLSTVRLAQSDDRIYVANMVAQHGLRSRTNPRPIRYSALADCLQQLARYASKLNASVHMPRIGCGLAGGDWTIVEALITEHLSDVPTYVYDL